MASYNGHGPELPGISPYWAVTVERGYTQIGTALLHPRASGLANFQQAKPEKEVTLS